LPFSGQ
jgi:hypothetical protein